MKNFLRSDGFMVLCFIAGMVGVFTLFYRGGEGARQHRCGKALDHATANDSLRVLLAAPECGR